MTNLHETTKSLLEIIDSNEAINLTELNNVKAMKYLCNHIHNIVTLFRSDSITDGIIVETKGVATATIFELRTPIIKKYIEVTDCNKEKLERLMNESQVTINEFNKLLNNYREAMGIHNYLSISPVIKDNKYKIKVSKGVCETDFIVIPELTYKILREIDKLSSMFSRYFSDRIVEEEYDKLNK